MNNEEINNAILAKNESKKLFVEKLLKVAESGVFKSRILNMCYNFGFRKKT